MLINTMVLIHQEGIVDEIEDIFLMGSWEKSLEKSREILIERQLSQKEHDDGAYLMENNDERLLSVYLQSIFELGNSDELEKAFEVVNACQPLSTKVAIQWSKFLIAMKQVDFASDVLAESAETLRSQLTTGQDDKLNEYTQVMEAMIFHVLLPQDLSEETLLAQVEDDEYLDQPAKGRFCKKIQSYYEGSLSKDHGSRTQANRNSRYKDSSSCRRTNQTSNQQQQQQKQKQGSNFLYEDETSNMLMIGGATLAAAVVFVGAIKYKDSIRGIIPSISKSLKDVKDAWCEL